MLESNRLFRESVASISTCIVSRRRNAKFWQLCVAVKHGSRVCWLVGSDICTPSGQLSKPVIEWGEKSGGGAKVCVVLCNEIYKQPVG